VPDSSRAWRNVDRLSAAALAAGGVVAGLLALDLIAALGLLGASNGGGGRSALALVTLAALLALLVVLALVGRSARRARRTEPSLDDRFEQLGIGVALFDAEDRLLRCNAAFRALYPQIGERLVPGAAYDDLMRAYYPLASAEVVAGRTLEEFVADSRARRLGQGFSEAVRRHDRGWLLMTDARTADGGSVSLRQEVAEQRVIDRELRQRRRAIDDLAELTGDWFWRTDAEGRFVEFSESMSAICKFEPAAVLGKRREELPGFECDPQELAAYQAALAAHEPFMRLRYRCLSGAGEPIWVSVSGRPLFAHDGAFVGYYGVGRDITGHESTILALRRSRERMRALNELATDWYWETDADLAFSDVRGPGRIGAAVGRRLRGRPLAYLLRHRRFRFDAPAVEGAIAARQAFRRSRLTVAGADGSVAHFEVSGQPRFERDRFCGYQGLAWNVSEREALLAHVSESEARFRALTALSSDWYWEMDAQLRLTSVQAGGAAANVEPAAVRGRALWELGLDPVRPDDWDEVRALLAAHSPLRDLLLRRPAAGDAGVRYTLVSADPVRDRDGALAGYRGVAKNITEQMRVQEHIERLARIDPLTQLPNRQGFDELAARCLSAALAEGRQCALLFIDLDDFRLLNNSYGHRVGDRVLALVAERMRAVVGAPDLLGRRGGDELVVLLADAARPELAVEVAQALIKTISEPQRVLGMEVRVTPSIGIAFHPSDGADLDALLSAADAAMYQAKGAGRKTYAFYTQAVARRVELRMRLEQRLRLALEARDFRLVYQPLVALADGRVIGAEALIRWKDAELGEIAPAEFIPIAEESGLIIGLGNWVLREVCRTRKVWRGLGMDMPPIDINFSSVQLRQSGCVESFLEVLAEHEVRCEDIEIEITETGLLDLSSVARENLVRLRNAGVRIALDDFGVGFSSLSHLRDLPISRLKIDRSFTLECMRDARTLTIVKAVIEMARSLGISVTAEGIETQPQQTWMQHLGCDSAQGYLFARPLPTDDFLRLFLDRHGLGRERSLMH